MSTKIVGDLVEEISKLTVLEMAELVKALEEKYGVSAAAPVAAAPASAAPAQAEEEEKAEFKVTLKEVGSEKIKVIKALRSVTSLTLKEAKDMTEAVPAVIAETAPKEEAKKIKETLESAGAKVELS
ncbi:50S ribosomal protein L7/L12 [Candidatus Dependentiae bacterium]|nr:50S ribosomal protein L7/L12 [Candidatus Dependentiae bacterium]